MFLEKFFPNRDIDSVYNFDFQHLYDEGIRLLLFDIDNTLVPHGDVACKKVIELFDKLKKIGFKTCLISNNSKKRVQPFATLINVDNYIYKASKPKDKAYLNAINYANESIKTTAFFGDQLFTDIYGAKRIGILSYVVKPINKKEEIQIILKRYLEKIIYHFYYKQKNTK